MVSVARWIIVGVVALFATATLPWHTAVAAPSPTDAAAVRAEIGRIYDWAGYQRDLPEELSEKARPPPDLTLDLGSLADVVLIGLVLIAILAAASWLHSNGWSGLLGRRPAISVDEVPAIVGRDRLMARLNDADRHAVSGEWGRAIHILLLTSIDLLRRRVGQDVPPAMTARELVGRAQVPDQARADFAALVAAAELCHFGGRPADGPLYDRCRVHYERLWGMPPEPVA